MGINLDSNPYDQYVSLAMMFWVTSQPNQNVCFLGKGINLNVRTWLTFRASGSA